MNMTSRINDHPALEARLAARLAGALTARAEDLPHDLSERLRFAREQALTRSRVARLAAPSGNPVVGVSARGAASLGRLVPWWQRAASVLPVLVLVAGLFAIQHWSDREQVLAAADIDTQLLADDLPPAAFADPGFAEYLRSAPAP
jgi:hypothetical protein